MNTITIGKILKPQGLKGEVKIQPFSGDENFYKTLKIVNIGDDVYKIKTCSLRQGFVYITFEGLNHIEQVEFLRGRELWVAGTSAPELKEGEYFVGDMLGLNVVDSEGCEYGKITDIEQYGSADVYTVAGAKGQFEFPFIKDLIVKVDLENKILVVNKKVFEEVSV